MDKNKEYNLTIVLPALIIAACTSIGVCFDLAGTLEPFFILGSKTATVWSVLFLTFIVAYKVIGWIYKLFDHWQISGKLADIHMRIPHIDKIEGMYKKHPFLTVYLLFLIVDLPYIIATYPAMFWGDTPAQIMQGYNLRDETASYLKLIDESINLNQHHPVPHTMLIHMCVALGRHLFGSYNVGIFIYAFLQFTFITLVIAYLVHFFYERKVPKVLLIAFVLFYLLSPRIQNHMLLVTKDIIYGGFTMLFVVSMFDLVNSGKVAFDVKKLLMVIISGLGVFFFRNEGHVVGAVVMIFALLLGKGVRKYVVSATVIVFAVYLVVINILFPALKISPGSRREKLCLPFQQTAYYLNKFPEEVTEEEKAVIGAVLDYDYMTTCYVWNRADPAKQTFNEYCTDEELSDYFRVWWEMFTKHPLVYFEATLHQTYGYFYPSAGFLFRVPYQDSDWLMQHTNKKCEEIGADFHYPEALSGYRWLYEKGWELIARIPPVLVLSLSATYLWSLILLFFYFIRRKRWAAFAVSWQLIVQYAVCFAGPFDGTCFRYIYPMAMTLIPLLLCGIFLNRVEN